MKKQACWIGVLALFGVLVGLTPDVLDWPLLNGFSGLAVKFFLAYCAIILVAQVFSALVGLRSTLEELTSKKKPARRLRIR